MFDPDNQQSYAFHAFKVILDRIPKASENNLEPSLLVKHILSSDEFVSNRYGYHCISDFSKLATTVEYIDLFYQIILGRTVELNFDYSTKISHCPTLYELRIVILRSREFSLRKQRILLNSYDQTLIKNIASILLLGRVLPTSNLDATTYAESIFASSEFVATRGLNNSIFYNQKSLLIVGFPKGVTSTIFQYTCRSLADIISPSPADDGEILNPSRSFSLLDLSGIDVPYYADGHLSYDFFEKTLNKFSNGFIVKDVCYPFHIIKYLKLNPNKFNVLFVDRSNDAVMSSHSRVGWNFLNLDKLNQVREFFDTYPSIDADHFLNDQGSLLDLLRKFYPKCISVSDFDLSR